MKKWLIIFISIIALLFLAIVITPFFIDVSSYRNTLLKIVEEKTGYQVTISGDVQLSIFPSTSLEVKDITVANAQSTEYPIATIKSAQVSVDLWALLDDKIAIESVVLDTPNFSLVTLTNGIKNWEVKKKKKASSPIVEQTANTANSVTEGITTTPAYAAESHPKAEENTNRYAFSIDEIKVDGGTITYEETAANKLIKITSLKLRSHRDDNSFPFDISGKVSGNMAPKEHFDISGIFSTEDAAYNFDKLEFSYNDVVEGYGLVDINLSQKMPYITSSINLKDLNVNAFLNPANPQTSFTDNLTFISSAHAAPSTTAIPANTPPWDDSPISLDALGQFNAKINLEIQKLQAKNFIIGPVSLNAYLNHGYLQTKLKKLALAEGTITGETIINIAGNQPKYKQTLYFSDLQLDYISPSSSLSKNLRGTLKGEVDVTSKGSSVKDIISSLNGTINLTATDGEIKSVDILSMIKNVQSAFGNHASSVKTVFDRISGSFTVKNGVLYNNDALLYSQWLRVTGKGNINLPQWKLDYKVTPDDSEGTELAKFKESSIPIIPVFVRGPLDAPKFIPDVSAIAQKVIKDNKAVNKVLDKAGSKLEEVLGKEQGGALKQEVLKGLEGIFNGF